jgi:hypothetical protein
VARAIVSLDGEPSLDEVVSAHARGRRLAKEPVPRLRGEAELEAVDRVGRQAAAAEIVAGGGGLRRRLQAAAEPLGGPGEDGAECRLLVGGQAATTARQIDPGTVRELLQSLAKLHLLHSHHEREHVATDVADPAAVGLPLRIDLQAGAGILMPRAEPGHGLALTPQRNVRPDDIDDVDGLADPLLDVVPRRR